MPTENTKSRSPIGGTANREAADILITLTIHAALAALIASAI